MSIDQYMEYSLWSRDITTVGGTHPLHLFFHHLISYNFLDEATSWYCTKNVFVYRHPPYYASRACLRVDLQRRKKSLQRNERLYSHRPARGVSLPRGWLSTSSWYPQALVDMMITINITSFHRRQSRRNLSRMMTCLGDGRTWENHLTDPLPHPWWLIFIGLSSMMIESCE